MIWHEPTHWPTHPPIHLSKGGSVSTNHKSSNRIQLSWLDQVLLKFLWFHMFWPTNPPIHQKRNTHWWGILHRFQIFKRNRNISIRSSLIAFLLIWGGYPLGGGWVGGSGWGWVGAPPMHTRTCTHANARTCTHTCMHVKHDKHGCLHGGGHLQFPNMFILAFRVCVCMHVHMSRTPPMPPDAPQPICPLPRAAGSRREPKSLKVYKSWTNWDNSILFWKIFTSEHFWTHLDSLWSP